MSKVIHMPDFLQDQGLNLSLKGSWWHHPYFHITKHYMVQHGSAPERTTALVRGITGNEGLLQSFLRKLKQTVPKLSLVKAQYY